MPGEENEVSIVVSFTAQPARTTLSLSKYRAMMLRSRLMTLLQGAQRLAAIAWSLNMLVKRQAILHSIEENSQMRLQAAKTRESMTIAKYGLHSSEAQQARRDVVIAQNMQERSSVRAKIMMESQYMHIYGAALSGLLTLQHLKQIWANAQSQVSLARANANLARIARFRRLLALRTALLAASIATAVVVNVLTLGIGIPGGEDIVGGIASEATQQEYAQSYHAGGVSPGGYAYLQQGETVGLSAAFSRPIRLTIKGQDGMSAKEIASEFWYRVERINHG